MNKILTWRNTLIFTYLLCFASASNAQINLEDSLVAYYPFKGNAKDMSGNGHNGSVNGATLATDRFGRANSAYFFDGTDDYISVPHDEDFNKLRKDKTISIWFKITETQTQYFPTLYYKEKSANDNYPTYSLALNVDPAFGVNRYKCEARFGASSTAYSVISKEKYTDHMNEWIHVLMTYSQSTGDLKLYFNGTLSDSTNIGNVTSNATTVDMQIGRGISLNNYGNNYFKGYIDDLRFYNRELNMAEIDSLTKYDDSAASASIGSPFKPNRNIRKYSLYPNPSSGQIAITSDNTSPVTVNIFDLNGRIVFNKEVNPGEILNPSLLPQGLYQVVFLDKQSGFVQNEKLFVK